MNLASKLDRLRGQASSGGGGTADEGLDARLNRLRRGPRAQPVGAAAFARLGHALGAETEGPGLLWRDRVHPLAGEGPDAGVLSRLPEACAFDGPDWVYLDTETTGLSGGVGNLAFMVGVARPTADRSLAVRQFVLGSFAAEAAMLRGLLDWIGPDAVLVSYNGKCFDLPLLASRLAMHRIDHALGRRRHLDLMYSVRRAYRRHWPDCRLQTAERRLLDFERRDDLPGAEAPAAWRAWLEQGKTDPLSRVLEHNFQDVVSLALLQRRLVDDYAGGRRTGIDHAAVARAWQGAARPQQARAVLERAGDALDEAGWLLLAGLYRQQGDWSRAKEIWRALHRGGCAAAASHLSKYYEHRVRDYRRAMGFAGDCEPAERVARLSRLERKAGVNLPLPW